MSIAFADPIKAFAKEVFSFTDEQINGDAKDVPDPRYGKPPRVALQTSAASPLATLYRMRY